MFKILKNNKPSLNGTFKTYEAARSYLRKHLRKIYEDTYSNPSFSALGYTIKRVS